MKVTPLPALLFLLVWATLCSAQTDLHFEHLSTQLGLSQSTVRSIYQDREGFLWFGTHNGLNRYDGYTFTVYKPDPRDPKHTFHHSIITDIMEDRKGKLWVATLGGGLHLVNKRTGIVTAYPIVHKQDAYWNTLFTILDDAGNCLWLATGNGLACFDPETRHYTLYPTQKYLTALTEDPAGRLWVGGLQGVHRFERATGKFTPVVLDHSLSNQPFISSLHLDAQGVLWAGSLNGGVWRLDTRHSSPQFQRYNPQGKLTKAIRYNGIISGKQGNIWLATGEGLQRIDPKTDQVITYESNPALPGTLSNNNIQSLYQDRLGNLWVGTNSGVNKASANSKQFHTYQIIPTGSSISLNNNYINTLLEDHTGTIWLGSNAGSMDGSFQNGLYQFDPKTKQVKQVRVDPSVPDSPNNRAVWSLMQDRQNRLWIGAQLGLYRYDYVTARFIRYKVPFSVRRMAEGQDGTLWLASTSAGDSAVIAAFSPERSQIVYYPYNEKGEKSLNSPFLYDILPSRDGSIYIATGGGGINRLNPRTGRFTHYLPGSGSSTNTLSDKEVHCLYEDEVGMIWAGTGHGGLNKLDPRTGTFTFYTTLDGLPSNRILSILGDRRENLWMGTANGLCWFTPTTKAFRSYDIQDGLPDNEFNSRAAYRHQNKLLFGTRNGFMAFYPDSLRDNTTPPAVFISGLSVMRKRRELPPDQLELPYDQNFLSFEFVALSYDVPLKNQYAFQLEGVDKDWVYSGTRRLASYTSLPPGRYTFRVKASNSDGYWNEQGAKLAIIIHPPWWRTWWFRLLLFVGLMGAAWLGLRLYTQSRLNRQRREMQRVLQAQEEERQRLAADLHDDLGATLSAIKGQLESVQPESRGLNRPIGLMEKAIRDLRLISHNLMPPEFNKLGLTESLRETVQRAQASSGLKFHFITYGPEQRLDQETGLTLYRIVLELINNTIKHARASQVTVQLIYYPDHFTLLVEDDGKGYPQDRGSAGIGLRNIRSRVDYLHGRLRVDTGARGTTVTLEVPLNRASHDWEGKPWNDHSHS
ncbi:sensor histidine kinase [Telluribacter sp.]|jgi:ligand-binding sensor domain-containing protein/signal transduction histidine kinase|uniref:sensor histidine kinase n=1 Tax=Telluribacter sp. TaxID=1978767 RepID=UPI002E11377E|nr:two-component regulator propeller domain-containing protein [Telluribacter sp.]